MSKTVAWPRRKFLAEDEARDPTTYDGDARYVYHGAVVRHGMDKLHRFALLVRREREKFGHVARSTRWPRFPLIAVVIPTVRRSVTGKVGMVEYVDQRAIMCVAVSSPALSSAHTSRE